MVSVEGVARRLNPDHDLWAAAKPVVEQWIQRELGPKAKARDFMQEGLDTLRALSKWAQAPHAPQTIVIERRVAARWPAVLSIVAAAGAAVALILSTGVLS